MSLLGPLAVCGCGCPVECCPLVVLVRVAAARCRRLLVLDSEAIVCLSCPLEGGDAGGNSLLGCRFGNGRVVLGLDQVVRGSYRVLALLGFLQFPDARADGGDPLTDLLVAGAEAARVTLHTYSLPPRGRLRHCSGHLLT